MQVHAGDCHMAGKRHRPVDRDEARRLLADGLRPCTHCRPDTQLDIPGLPRGTKTLRHRPLPQGHQRHEHSPAPTSHRRPRPVRVRLPWKPGRPLRRMPAQDLEIRPRRQPRLPVVHGTRPRTLGTDRSIHQHPRLTAQHARHRVPDRPGVHPNATAVRWKRTPVTWHLPTAPTADPDLPPGWAAEPKLWRGLAVVRLSALPQAGMQRHPSGLA
ncbi:MULTISPECIES: DUF6233 domain-containing protein [unclassified Streptomyces]|uniref:DUF6233 domain-containing protein n=1 Tax=unclassified Streptomyces TaxID=2593676 RepID=UPI001F5BF721|nr:DUF6233 domain-containing protein [Streptomyces sp. Root1310]